MYTVHIQHMYSIYIYIFINTYIWSVLIHFNNSFTVKYLLNKFFSQRNRTKLSIVV